jgi:hypothetical protein
MTMSVGSLGGIVSSAAGAPLSQTAGSETERAQKDSLAQGRQVDANQKAERAAGIGQTEQDQETSERDADGRRLWEAKDEKAKKGLPEAEAADTPIRQSKDATGQSGTQLDLTG